MFCKYVGAICGKHHLLAAKCLFTERLVIAAPAYIVWAMLVRCPVYQHLVLPFVYWINKNYMGIISVVFLFSKTLIPAWLN